MIKRFTIIYHPEAEGDFDLIDEFISEYAGEAAANRIVDVIRSTISKLTDFPHIGSVRDDIIPDLRAIPAAEKATICFTVDDEMHIVKIVCVTYAGQDWQKIAKTRK